MSSHIPVWDSTHLQYDDDEIQFDNPYEPWKNVTKLTKTVTTSIKGIQETLYTEYKNRKNLLKEEDVAEALADRNLLRLTHTIQISSNRQFLAITFQNKQIMETFCTEPLLVKGFNITFSPQKNFPKKKTLLNISFLNIPAEKPNEPLTEYLSEYADIVGIPLHIAKDHHGIPYYTGTLVYQVSKLYQHLPRHINDMFGRTVLCIYDNQPTDWPGQRNNTNRYYRQKKTNHYSTQNERHTNKENQSESENESENENQQNQQQQKTTITTTNEIQQQNQTENQNQKQKETTNSQQQQENITVRKHKNPSTKQYQINKEPPPKNNENYPEIQETAAAKENDENISQTQQQQQSDTIIIPETQITPEIQTQETTQVSFLSPSMVTKNRYQILNSTPETIDIKTPETNEINTTETTSTPTPQHEQHQKAKTFATRLYRMNFADTGSFINATLQEKENLTALSMYYTVGQYDPSNKFIKNFRNKDIIDTYKIITEAKTTKTNTLNRIYKHLNAITERVEKRKLAKKQQQQKNTLKVILNNTN